MGTSYAETPIRQPVIKKPHECISIAFTFISWPTLFGRALSNSPRFAVKKYSVIYDVQMSFSVYRPPTSGVNILTNPGFEQPLVNDPVKGWSCQGEMDDPRGGVIARYTRHQAKQGQHSGICLARLSEWAGPGQYIGKVPVQGIIKMDSAHSSSNK